MEIVDLIKTAQAAERKKAWPDAERAWRSILGLNNNFWIAYLGLAQTLRELERFDELLVLVKNVEELIPADHYILKARLAEVIEDWSTAADRWLMVTEQSGSDWFSYVSLSRAYEKIGHLGDCFNTLWRAEIKFPTQVNIIRELALVAQRHQWWHEAARCWQKFFGLVPDDLSTIPQLAFVSRRLRDSICQNFKDSSAFSYKSLDSTINENNIEITYQELHSEMMQDLSTPAFLAGAFAGISADLINSVKFHLGAGAYTVKNSKIFRERLVSQNSTILFGPQIHVTEQQVKDNLDRPICLPIRDLKCRPARRPIVSLQIGAYPVYGHWLVDAMPQIFGLKSLGFKLEELDFAFPNLLPKFSDEFLGYCDVHKDQIFIYNHETEFVEAPTVVIPTHMNNTRTFVPTFPDAVRWFRNNVEIRYGRSLRDESKPRRIFVSRRDVNSGRPLQNRDELVELAKSRGFTVVLPEALPLTEQWSYFASADVIVGEYGSALHSTIFSRAGTVVCCIRGNPHFPGYLQSGIGEALQQPTAYIFGDCEQSNIENSQIGPFPYTVDREVFTNSLDLLLGRQKAISIDN